MPEGPDYHFLYIPPALGADWLFIAARRYWDRFRPIVIDNLDLIGYVPPKRSVAITILARRDLAPVLIGEVRQRFPAALHDPLVYDAVGEMRLTLDGRADLGQRFGLLDDPTPTPGQAGS